MPAHQTLLSRLHTPLDLHRGHPHPPQSQVSSRRIHTSHFPLDCTPRRGNNRLGLLPATPILSGVDHRRTTVFRASEDVLATRACNFGRIQIGLPQ